MNLFKKDQIIKIEIDGIGINGEGVGHSHGYTVFVNGALSGEEVSARLTECRKRYGRAELISVEKRSPDRAEPPCALFGRCGGCQLMHLSYQKQLEVKRQRVADALSRIGKIETEIGPCLGSPSELSYRNKIQIPVKEGRLGLYERSSHRLVELDGCHIHCPIGEKIYKDARAIIQRSNISDLRHVLIKSAIRTQEALVILVTDGNPTPSLAQIADEIMTQCPSVKGVVHNKHAGRENVILGTVYSILRGAGSITERLCGLSFKISPASFFQVNPPQAEQLYSKALEFAEMTGGETVLDAYCGVGTLALVFAHHARNVIGVECVPEAIDDAKENAKRNSIQNARFVCAKSEDFIASLPSADLILLNPPRKGCEPKCLEGIGLLSPKKLIYISCDPATLARDLNILATFGYRVDQVQPFDMFPHTAHVECVAKLSKTGNITN